MSEEIIKEQINVGTSGEGTGNTYVTDQELGEKLDMDNPTVYDIDEKPTSEMIHEAGRWNGGGEKNIFVEAQGDMESDITVTDYVHVDADLSADSNGSNLDVNNAKRGNISTGEGDDTVEVSLSTNSKGWDNKFNIDTNEGDDTVIVTEGEQSGIAKKTDGSYTTTNVELGDGDDTYINHTQSDDVVHGDSEDTVSVKIDMSNGKTGDVFVDGEKVGNLKSDDNTGVEITATNPKGETAGFYMENEGTGVSDGSGGQDKKSLEYIRVNSRNDNDQEGSETMSISVDGTAEKASVKIGGSKGESKVLSEGEAGKVTAYLNGKEVGSMTFTNKDLVDVNSNGQGTLNIQFGTDGNSKLFDTLTFEALIGDDFYEENGAAHTNYNIGGAEFTLVETGNDYIDTGAGNDVIDGGYGNDVLIGGTGADKIDGGAGHDTYKATSEDGVNGVNIAATTDPSAKMGASTYEDSTSGDVITGVEKMVLTDKDDTFTGGQANEKVHGGAGNDDLNGGAGNDKLVGGKGVDHLDGGAGNDKLIGGKEWGETIDGGSGKDTAVFSGNTADGAGVYVNLTEGKAASVNDKDGAHDTLIEIENVNGSKHDDIIVGDEGNNVLKGNRGVDHLEGGAGNDKLVGGKEWGETIDGGEGNDTASFGGNTANGNGVYVNLAEGRANALDNNGNVVDSEQDTLTSIENAHGSRNDDVMVGSLDDNKLSGGRGDDYLHGGASVAGDELITNGGFEANPVRDGSWSGIKGGIDGWTATNSQGEEGYLEIQNGSFGGTPANARDNSVVELDSKGEHSNTTISQTVAIEESGTFTLSFDFSGREKSGEVTSETSEFTLQVTDGVGNEFSQTINPEKGWESTSLELQLQAGDATITFSAGGNEDTYGALIDNVSLKQVVGSDDVLKGGKGDDILVGGAGKDQLFGGKGNDTIVFDEEDFLDVASKTRKDGVEVLKEKVYGGGQGFDVLTVGDGGADGINTINMAGRGINGIEAVVSQEEDTSEIVTVSLNEIARQSDDAAAKRDKGFDAFTFIGNGGDDQLVIADFKKWDLVTNGYSEGKAPSNQGQIYNKADVLGKDEVDILNQAAGEAVLSDTGIGLNQFVFKRGSQYVTIWTDLTIDQIYAANGKEMDTLTTMDA